MKRILLLVLIPMFLIVFITQFSSSLVKAAPGQWSANGSTIYYNDGWLGLGTSNPQQLLELLSSGNTAMRFHAPNIAHYVMGIHASDEGKFKIGYGSTLDNAASSLVIKKDGNIGFGTASPLQALEILKSNMDAGIRFHIPNRAHFSAGIDNDDGKFKIQTGASITGTPGITVDGNNNVGIGTSNPTYKLSVNGTIRAKEVLVNTNWADYVFEDNYELMSLGELREFISKNKHLPGVPSAIEVEANGISVGEMNKIQMEKIEELTLYIFELEERIEELENSK